MTYTNEKYVETRRCQLKKLTLKLCFLDKKHET